MADRVRVVRDEENPFEDARTRVHVARAAVVPYRDKKVWIAGRSVRCTLTREEYREAIEEES